MPRPDLSVVTAAVQEAAQSARAPRSRKPASARRRDSTVALTIHVDGGVRTQVKILAAEHGTTVHALVCEGLNAVFAKYGRPEIAQ
jgi:hypothetical protein